MEEKEVVLEEGGSKTKVQRLKEEFKGQCSSSANGNAAVSGGGGGKEGALNKIAHGLHIIDPIFQAYCFQTKMTSLVRSLGWVNPVVPQSMYILKSPKIGGEVTAHVDSTFLYTTPRQTCLGLLLFLEDSLLSNGCIWVRPGSHREPLRRAFVRSDPDVTVDSPLKFVKASDWEKEGCKAKAISEKESAEAKESPKLSENDPWNWEGTLPTGAWPLPSPGLFEKGFVPVECKRGSLLVFPGTLEHLSLFNRSEKSRHCFQLHLVEGPKAGVKWSDGNWLQYSGGKGFVELP